MQYAPTKTWYVSIKYILIESFSCQEFDSLSIIESRTRYVWGRMQYAPTLTDQKIDSPLKPPTPNDPFLWYRCRGVLHTPHKCRWQWANDSFAGYVSVKYVLIESYTRQKFDSPLKQPTPKDPFFVYSCRGVLHTPHKCPWQWANDSSSLYIVGRMQYAPTKTWYVSIKYVLIESFSCQEFDPLSFIESYTRQKFDSPLSIESSTRYVLGRMQYAPTLTDQKLDSPLSIESSARYVFGMYAIRPYTNGSKIQFPFIHRIKNPIRLGLHAFTAYPFPARNP